MQNVSKLLNDRDVRRSCCPNSFFGRTIGNTIGQTKVQPWRAKAWESPATYSRRDIRSDAN